MRYSPSYQPWTWELIEHHRYWTPARLEAERIAAALRVTLRRNLRRNNPDLVRMFDLPSMGYEALVGLCKIVGRTA